VIWLYVMALAWFIGMGAIAVGLAALILHVCWLVEDRSRRRRRDAVREIDLTRARS
jgi:hypothetical protein